MPQRHQHEYAGVYTQRSDVGLLAHDPVRHAFDLVARERSCQRAVGTTGILVRAEIVGTVVPLRIDGSDRDEAGECDVARFFRRKRLELVGLQQHDLAGRGLVSTLHLVVGNDFIRTRVHHCLCYRREVGAVQQTEVNVVILNGGIELDRHAGVSDPQHSFPHCANSHDRMTLVAGGGRISLGCRNYILWRSSLPVMLPNPSLLVWRRSSRSCDRFAERNQAGFTRRSHECARDRNIHRRTPGDSIGNSPARHAR